MKIFSILITIFLLFVFCDTSVSAKNNNEKEEIVRRLDEFMLDCYETGIFNGCILVSKNNEIVYKKALGYSDIFKGTPMKIESKFDIASITKSFTAMAIMILKEQGKLSLEDKLSKYFPNFPNYAKKITIHHLLSHQSGIKDFDNDLGMSSKELNHKKIIKKLETEKLLFRPGKSYRYSNSGYFLLGRIIEKASGLSYSEFLEQNIFQILKMNNTVINDGEDVNIEDKAVGRFFSEPKEVKDHITGPSGIFTTVDDLYKYHRDLYESKILSSQSLETMLMASNLSNGNPTRYSYGGMIYNQNNLTTLELGGASSAGYLSYLIHPVCCEYSIILLYNYFISENFSFVLKGITSILEGENPELKKTQAIYKLNKYIIENGVNDLTSVYHKLNADTLHFIPLDEIDLVLLSSFYKNRNQFEKAIAVLNIYKDEFPNSIIPYDELIDIYKKMKSDELSVDTKNVRQSLEKKLLDIEDVEIQLHNPKTKDSKFYIPVRSGPGRNYVVISKIRAGKTYIVVGKSMNGKQLKLKNGGWIFYRKGSLTNEQYRMLPIIRYIEN